MMNYENPTTQQQDILSKMDAAYAELEKCKKKKTKYTFYLITTAVSLVAVLPLSFSLLKDLGATTALGSVGVIILCGVFALLKIRSLTNKINDLQNYIDITF